MPCDLEVTNETAKKNFQLYNNVKCLKASVENDRNLIDLFLGLVLYFV